MFKKDLTGNQYGRLTVIGYAGTKKSGKNTKQMWLCRCTCGNEKIISAGSLISHHATSCGCLHKEMVGRLNRTHNLSCGKCGNRLYDLWKSIKYRCYCKTNKSYKNYGGRGITVCDEWKDNFLAFYNWAVSNGYKKEKLKNGLNKWTIDRIDNDKGYSPENCRFITNKEQALNKRNTMTYDERYIVCPVCHKIFKVKQRQHKKTCSRKCSVILRNKEREEKNEL